MKFIGVRLCYFYQVTVWLLLSMIHNTKYMEAKDQQIANFFSSKIYFASIFFDSSHLLLTLLYKNMK